ncbi:hypothetical protein HNQ56_000969 [Anaerotaenia torta]|uniref:hypothetical protein n=1 Tax=Anaerotaenia torta TaxID=433293 RepID=UPI003D1C9213
MLAYPIFDTIGTFIGTGKKSGIFDTADEKALQSGAGFKSKMDKALFADSVVNGKISVGENQFTDIIADASDKIIHEIETDDRERGISVQSIS